VELNFDFGQSDKIKIFSSRTLRIKPIQLQDRVSQFKISNTEDVQTLEGLFSSQVLNKYNNFTQRLSKLNYPLETETRILQEQKVVLCIY
jgi:hypothetical protein